MQSFVCSVSTYASEIWNTSCNAADQVERVFSEIQQRILGTQSRTPDVLLRAELGVLSQQGERDLCSLKFLHRLLTMSRDRLVCRIFKCLYEDPRRGTVGGSANWVTLTIPRILERYSIDPCIRHVPSSKKKWKKRITEAVHSTESARIGNAGPDSTKLDHYRSLRRTDGMPRYLRHRRTWFFNYGRNVKTKLRCDTSELEIDAGRRARPFVPREQRICRCCNLNAVESAYHFLFDCTLHAHNRLDMTDAIDDLVSTFDPHGWGRMTWPQRHQFLLGDGPDPSDDHEANAQWIRIEIVLYRYLALAYKERRSHLS